MRSQDPNAPFAGIRTERKHLTDITKMLAHQVESDLLALLRPLYARAKQEGLTLLHDRRSEINPTP